MGVLDRVRRAAWGISGRLIASYVLVTLAVVVLVEAIVLGYQAPRLVNDTQLQAELAATAQIYSKQVVGDYRYGIPAGTVLGESGQPVRPGHAQPASDGATLVVPAITGPLKSDKAVTAMVAIAQDGTIIASSVPAWYPPGQPAADLLPKAAAMALAAGPQLSLHAVSKGSTRRGHVWWTVVPAAARAAQEAPAGAGGSFPASLYLQAPVSTGSINPIRAWSELRHQAGAGPLLTAAYVLLIAIVPVGVLFGLLASRRLVRRVRRLEQATVAVADGDYTVTLPTSGRDEVGRLEANFTTMTQQLASALSAERERASGGARAAERARIAREIHDAISQHLFGLRMIAAGMRRADPDHPQVQAIERITDEALRDMQALLLELRPAGLDGGGLAPALQQMCVAYRDRLGVTIDADIDDITVPEPVEHALLRIAQEACTNAVRHGNARRLALHVTRRDGHIELAVCDTGTGFDPSAPHTGSGLAHIRDRVAELGGTVDIDSAPGAGTALTVRVPAP